MANQYLELIIKDGFLIRGSTSINMHEVYEYYITQNHSRKETEKYFKLTPRMFEKIRDAMNIKKSKKLSYEHNKKTLKALYGDEHYNNHDQCVQTCLDKYGCQNVFQSEQIKEASLNTKLKKYGNKHYVNQAQAKETCLARYGCSNVNQVQEIKDKKKQTCLKHFGVCYPMQAEIVKAKYDFQDIVTKAFNTKKLHGTTNTSKIQKWFTNELIQIYGVDNVLTEYKEARYPYHCDVYIKSLDQFIELNLYFTHGGHPFGTDLINDTTLLNKWKEKAKTSKFFANAIKVWTDTDIAKQKCAKENNLNYIMFYNEQDIKNYINKLRSAS